MKSTLLGCHREQIKATPSIKVSLKIKDGLLNEHILVDLNHFVCSKGSLLLSIKCGT